MNSPNTPLPGKNSSHIINARHLFEPDEKILIYEHALKHGLSEEEIIQAWRNKVCWVEIERDNEEHDIVSIGFDTHGRPVEMTGRIKDFGILIYHANTPPTPRAYKELGLRGTR